MCYTYLMTKNIGSIVRDSAWEVQYHVINLKQYSLPTPERGQLTFSMQSFVLLEEYYRYVLNYLYIGMWCLYENMNQTLQRRCINIILSRKATFMPPSLRERVQVNPWVWTTFWHMKDLYITFSWFTFFALFYSRNTKYFLCLHLYVMLVSCTWTGLVVVLSRR
jgi:hypothetical protein